MVSQVNLQALITADHVSVVMQIVTNATRDGVIFWFTLRCCLSFFATSFMFVSAGVGRQTTIVILHQGGHRSHTGLFNTVQVGLNSTG